MESQSPSDSYHNLPIERVAFGMVLLSVLALSLIKIGPTDTSWHLATAKLAFSSGEWWGKWPTTNTFSYTFPNYPLYQQYPVFQALLYSVFRHFSWTGLSILHALMWTLTFLIWVSWSGGLKKAICSHHLLVFLALGLHQRMLPRPLMLSLPIVMLIGLSIERYRKSTSYSSSVIIAGTIVLLQTLLTLSHQVFPVGILLVFSYCVHLVLVKTFKGSYGISSEDQHLPLLPIAMSLVLGILSCLLNPLGTETFLIPWRTSQTLTYLKPYVLEFESIFSHPYPLTLLAFSVLFACKELWKSRKNTQPYYFAVFAMALVLGSTFWRGIGFSVSFLLFIALVLKQAPRANTNRRLGTHRILTLTFTFSACLFIIFYRWVAPVQSIYAPQPGVGQALGQWPSSSVEALKRFPPPGNLMNASWYTGNAVIYSLYPEIKPFSDPRFEAYPPEFLKEAILGMQSLDSFYQLAERYDISWVLFQMKNAYLRRLGAQLLESGKWKLVAIDSILFALVEVNPQTKTYLEKHSISPASVTFDDLLEEPKSLRDEQLLIINEWKKLFGQHTDNYEVSSN